MLQFLRIQKFFIIILTEIRKYRRRINKSAQPILEKSIYDPKLTQDSVFVEYFDLIILYFELGEYERESC
jgi:hypothetical protein